MQSSSVVCSEGKRWDADKIADQAKENIGGDETESDVTKRTMRKELASTTQYEGRKS